ncbi:unnamed protein product [Rotaria socialis]|uniref:Helix-turn-helix domain-containing protein n=1 Tax=Rotaria socialis TaxID=392032 RepID=A0A817UP00_9BILA|nr:unnamed protein product [Rotaria socialis]CAF4396590.1 unnamed protein product [Rotaria socialis]
MADPSDSVSINRNRFDDVFHEYDDDLDEHLDTNVDFDNLYTYTGKDNDEDVGDIDILMDITSKQEEKEAEVTIEEQLSQKLSQLSASGQNQTKVADHESTATTKKRPSSSSSIMKKLKTDQANPPIEWIPNYLSKANGTFDEILRPILTKQPLKYIDIEDLRQFAIFIHKMKCLELDRLLWNKYFESGTGELIKQEHIRSVLTIKRKQLPMLQWWPIDLRLKMVKRRQATVTDPEEIDQEECLDCVERVLMKYDQQIIFYQEHLKNIKARIGNLMTEEIENAINTFVQQQGLSLYRIQIDKSIASVEYDYKDHLIKLEFYEQRTNRYQKKTFENLFQLKRETEQAKLDVAILKQRLAYKNLPKSFDSLRIPTPIDLNTITDSNLRQRLNEQCQKILQRTTSDMMLVYIAIAETKYNEWQIKFDKAINDMKKNLTRELIPENLTQSMLDIMYRRFQNLDERLISSYKLKLNFFEQAPTYLSSKQIEFLNRGPTYVSPCQLHIQSSSSLSIDEILIKQMAPLRRQLTRVFTNYPVNLSRRMNFEQQIQQLFKESFHQPSIPVSIKERVLAEKKILQSIQYQLKRQRLILRRTADDQNTYYLGQLDEFEKKTKEYMEDPIYYTFIGMITEKYTEQYHLNDILALIDSQLQVLNQKKLINHDHLSQFSTSHRSNLKLPYLYFLPETNDDDNVDICVQPRFSSYQHSPIQRLAQYLEPLIRSLFDNVCRSTTVLNSHDFYTKFFQYWMQQTDSTERIKFATFKIHDLYSNISHRELLEALYSLLVHPLIIGRHERLSNEAIVELTSIVLRNNYFIYQDQIYRFARGCPLNLPLSQLLGSIYLHQWQTPLFRQIRLKDTFYARFYDQGFLTWKESNDQLQIIFDELQQILPSEIQMTTFIGTNVHFLICYMENIKGRLHTNVYRDTTQQPFVLPYFSNHPRLLHRKWYRFMMIRATQFCKDFQDFQDERRYIEASFLANGYSLDFIEYLWRQLILQFQFSPLDLQNLDQYKFRSFRIEIQRCLKAQRLSSQQEQEYNLIKNQKLIRLYYLFDWGARCEFNQNFQKLWCTIINEDPLFKSYGLKIILNSKHCYLSNTLLAC